MHPRASQPAELQWGCQGLYVVGITYSHTGTVFAPGSAIHTWTLMFPRATPTVDRKHQTSSFRKKTHTTMLLKAGWCTPLSDSRCWVLRRVLWHRHRGFGHNWWFTKPNELDLVCLSYSCLGYRCTSLKQVNVIQWLENKLNQRVAKLIASFSSSDKTHAWQLTL